jgi:hypothetical protein
VRVIIELNSKATKAEKTKIMIQFEKKTRSMETIEMFRMKKAKKLKRWTLMVDKFDRMDQRTKIKKDNYKKKRFVAGPYACYLGTRE